VYYHRGNKLRGELKEFSLGISKSIEAIENSIGTPKAVQLENTGDMTMFTASVAMQQLKKPNKGKKPGRNVADKVKPPPKASDRTVKQLLGELYADQVYLQKLMEDPSFVTAVKTTADDDDEGGPPDLSAVVSGGLNYLEIRSQFWRQQKPIYARIGERRNRAVKTSTLGSGTGERSKNDAAKVIQRLDIVEETLDDGDYERARMLAENLLHVVDDMHGVPRKEKMELAAAVNSALGNAQLELGMLDESEEAHVYDLRYSEELGADPEGQVGILRAKANLGRVYARQGDYEKAIAMWTERGPSGNPLENTWLYHEIARCYIEMEDYVSALEQAGLAYDAANAAKDDRWKLNAVVLKAQITVSLGKVEEAVVFYNEGLLLAKTLNDTGAEAGIQHTIDKLTTAEGHPDADAEDEKEADDGILEPTTEEIAKKKELAMRLYTIFQDADNSHGGADDGQLDFEEIHTRLDTKALQKVLADAGIIDRFARGRASFVDIPSIIAGLDNDGDGKVSLQEFLDLLDLELPSQEELVVAKEELKDQTSKEPGTAHDEVGEPTAEAKEEEHLDSEQPGSEV
jgi:tetratricopeptide (TPR) repeat protein